MNGVGRAYEHDISYLTCFMYHFGGFTDRELAAACNVGSMKYMWKA